MLANFTGEDSLVKPPQPVDGGSTEGVKQGLSQLYAFLDDKGYAMSTEVVDAGPLSVQVTPPLIPCPRAIEIFAFRLIGSCKPTLWCGVLPVHLGLRG